MAAVDLLSDASGTALADASGAALGQDCPATGCGCGGTDPGYVRSIICGTQQPGPWYARNTWTPEDADCAYAAIGGVCYLFRRNDPLVPAAGITPSEVVVPTVGDCCTCAQTLGQNCLADGSTYTTDVRCCCGRRAGNGNSQDCEYRVGAWRRVTLDDQGLGQFGDPYFTETTETLAPVAPTAWIPVQGAFFGAGVPVYTITRRRRGIDLFGAAFDTTDTYTRDFRVVCGPVECDAAGSGGAPATGCRVAQVPAGTFNAWRLPSGVTGPEVATPCMRSYVLVLTKTTTGGGTTRTTTEEITVEFRCLAASRLCVSCGGGESGPPVLLGDAAGTMAAAVMAAENPEDLLP